MAVAETRLRIVLVDEATAELIKLNKAASSLSSSLLGANTSGYAKQLDNINVSVGKVTESFNSMSKAIGVVTGAYKTFGTLANLFSDVFKGTFDYYKSFQSNSVGIAGILSSMTELNGKTLEWNQAMGFSQDIMKKLRKEALQTSATSTDLIETFRGILGPALSQGMNIDEILKFTTVGTNAVRSLGLPSNQYLQELRSILTGNIRASSSTLATALGITNEDVKKAKDSAEGLFTFLMKRMKGFVESVPATSQTIAGQLAIMEEAFKASGAEAYDTLFKSYSKTLEKINGIMLTKNQDGEFVLNDAFIEKVKGFGEFLDGVFSRLVDNSKLIVEHFDKIAIAVGAFFVLPTVFDKLKNVSFSAVDAYRSIKGSFGAGEAYDKQKEITIANAKAKLVRDEANAHLKILDTINKEVSQSVTQEKIYNQLVQLMQKHQAEASNVERIIQILVEGGVNLQEAYKRAYDYLKAISSTDTHEQERAARMLKALEENHGKLQEARNNGVKQIESSFSTFDKWNGVIHNVTTGVAKLTNSLSMASFAVLAFTDENDTVTRTMAECVIGIDAGVSALSGLTGVLKEATEWWGKLELAQKSAYLSMLGTGAVVAVGATFVAAAAYKGYNDYQNWKAGGKAVIEGDSVRFEAPEKTFTPEELQALEKSAITNTDDDDYDERPDYINKLKYSFDTNTGGGGSSKEQKGKSPEEIARETKDSYAKLIESIKSSKENALDFGNAYQKVMASADKQTATWTKTLNDLKSKGVLSKEEVNNATKLMNDYYNQMISKAREAERSEKINVLKAKIGQADNVMLFGGSQEEQYKRKNDALQNYRAYLDRILEDTNLNVQQRLAYEQQYADVVKQIRQNDMYNFKTAWKATLQELSQQQINYGESIRSVFSSIETSATNLLTSTESFGTRIKNFFSDIASSIMAEMSKLIMKALITNVLLKALSGFGGFKAPSNVKVDTPLADYNIHNINDMENAKLFKDFIPGKATGGYATGWNIVGERGPELVNFSNPGRVYTAEQTRNALSGGASGVNIKIDLHNESGQPMQAETTGSSFDGESYVVGVVLKAISTNKNGMRNIIKGVATT